MTLGRVAIVGALVGGLWGGTAVAQLAPSALPSAPAVKPEQLSDQEKLARAKEYLTQMRKAVKEVNGKLEEARSSKDVVKLNCVNEKLTNLKGLLRISEQALVALQDAVAKKEGQAAEHEFMKLTIAHQRVLQLKAEAEQCVGMLAFEIGDTETTVEEPADLPQLDPTRTTPPDLILTRPPPASPFD